MRGRRWLAVVALGGVLGACGGAGVPDTGEVLYRRWCASCHGLDGRGDGPAAGELARRPVDLTALDADVPALMQAIDGRRTVRAHGPADMPVWGTVLQDARTDEPYAGHAALREVQALAEYVRGLQRPPQK